MGLLDSIGNAMGEFMHTVGGGKAAMQQQYEQNKELAKNQYQWAVEDMQKAGLNPAQMFGGGAGHTASASTGTATGQNIFANTAQTINSVTNLVNSFNKDKDKSNNINGKTLSKVLKIIIN